MAYRTEAYDFSYFEERNTAPKLEPQVVEEQAGNVVELPEQQGSVVELPEQPGAQPKKQAKVRRNPLKMVAGTLCFITLFAAGLTAVLSEVQLTELTEKINETQNLLDEAESLEIQLNMQAAQRMTDAQVEDYVEQQLGMGKATGSQVFYRHVAQQDKGTVVQELEDMSAIDQFFAQIRAWLAG
ncbi:hypothetical protein [Acutalibacter caecimuris]|uniref:hypothetical protein n=1 Tax=Acutalibacter caecimuris TaxID=3093657 RepID=UPI002AC8A255|nr:hypothetical protein [Acutalibacter sp. M00118]